MQLTTDVLLARHFADFEASRRGWEEPMRTSESVLDYGLRQRGHLADAIASLEAWRILAPPDEAPQGDELHAGLVAKLGEVDAAIAEHRHGVDFGARFREALAADAPRVAAEHARIDREWAELMRRHNVR